MTSGTTRWAEVMRLMRRRREIDKLLAVAALDDVLARRRLEAEAAELDIHITAAWPGEQAPDDGSSSRD